MNTPIKAIETNWNGYHFRSRLEARWAVFFQTARIKWEYEPEGYVLPSGPYLPDFWLPDLDMWAEVKPNGFKGDPRHGELVAASRKEMALLVGTPGGDNSTCERIRIGCSHQWADAHRRDSCPDPSYYKTIRQSFCVCPCGGVGYGTKGIINRVCEHLLQGGFWLGCERAIAAARGARFDSGRSR